MSPETLNWNKPTNKVNIWAIGIILYELLSKNHPFYIDDSLSIGAITNE